MSPDPVRRSGDRPEVTNEGPQSQLTQRSTPELWGRLVAAVFALPDVVEAHSQVSPASSRAVFLDDRRDHRAPETGLAPDGRLEPVHLHGVDDTSLHLVLPPERGAELTGLGWAEPHQYGDFGTEFFVYGPRDDVELEAVLGFVREALAFARGEERSAPGVDAADPDGPPGDAADAREHGEQSVADWSFALGDPAAIATPPTPEQSAALERAAASLARARAAYAAAREAAADAEALIIAAHEAGASRDAIATHLDLAYTHVPALVSGERGLLPPIG
ncbi:luciferase domain-containing protein [Schumannella soli]|uniref:luciferase domain-containing protein n=1 Tax=Schumannella soli TaxID=2590779 RepID=UPI0015E83455|nr:luciferase family protein [Schumannella soli]